MPPVKDAGTPRGRGDIKQTIRQNHAMWNCIWLYFEFAVLQLTELIYSGGLRHENVTALSTSSNGIFSLA